MFQSDSGRTAHTRPLRCSSVALGTSKAKAPTKGLSKLNSMAFGLAVYASQDGSPRHHARLASGRWSGVTARAFHPQGSYERFQSCILTSHPPCMFNSSHTAVLQIMADWCAVESRGAISLPLWLDLLGKILPSDLRCKELVHDAARPLITRIAQTEDDRRGLVARNSGLPFAMRRLG